MITYLAKITIFILLCCIATLPSYGQKKNKNKVSLTPKELQITEATFIEGNKFLLLEDDVNALKSFKKIISVDPNNAAVNHFISQILQRQYKYDDALPYALKAYNNNLNNEYYYLSLANIYINKENYKEAAKIYEKLIKKFTPNEDNYFDLAEIYSRMKKWEKSIEVLNDFSEKFGVFDEIVFYKQSIYLNQNKIEEALKEGKTLIELYPSEPQYVVKQAQILLSNEKTEEAEKLLIDFTNQYDQSLTILLMLSDISRSKNQIELANQYYIQAYKSPEAVFEKKIDLIAFLTRKMYMDKIQNKYDSSNTNLTKLLCDDILEVFPEKAKSHTINADFYNLIDNKKEAQQNYVNGLKIDGTDFNTWEQLILIDAELEEYDSLAKHSYAALELFPNQGVVWYFNGSANLILKNHKEAIFSFEKAKKLSQGNIRLLADINAQLGDAYNAVNEYEKSDLAYEEVLAVNPNNDHVLNNYSYYLSLRNEKLEKAYQMSKKTLENSPENSTYIDTHAWVLYKMSKYEEAEVLLRKIIENTTSGEVLEHYADILYKLNRVEEAFDYWKKAAALGGGSSYLNKKIKDKALYE